MKTNKIIHLMSGGLDSTTLLYKMVGDGVDVHCLLINYHARHNQHELNFARGHCRRLGVNYSTFETSSLGGLTKENWRVGNRNMILASIAGWKAAEMGYNTITLGCNAADRDYFPDCRQEFWDSINKSFPLAGYDIKVEVPFIDKSKAWIGGLAQELGVPMHEVWTCYQPTESGPCNECPACLKLKEAVCGQ